MYQQLFYFVSAKYAKSNLRNKRIKIATINSLNDPFEFSVPVIRNGVASEEAVQQVKDHFDSRLGFICLNKAWYNPVHWSHYGDSHKGICLGFNIKKSLLQKITYRKSRIAIDAGPGFYGDEDPAYLNYVKQTLVKYKDWSYEKESRISINLLSEEVISEDGFKFIPIDGDDIQLAKVIIGSKAPAIDQELIDVLQGYEEVSLMQSRLCSRFFRVVNAWDEWKLYGFNAR